MSPASLIHVRRLNIIGVRSNTTPQDLVDYLTNHKGGRDVLVALCPHFPQSFRSQIGSFFKDTSSNVTLFSDLLLELQVDPSSQIMSSSFLIQAFLRRSDLLIVAACRIAYLLENTVVLPFEVRHERTL